MAKLKAPLLSLGASGAIGKAIVYFPWKGLNVAREYVVPANPKSTAQKLQRGYLTDAVTMIHNYQAVSPFPIAEDDIRAYALWGSIYPTPRTWFNQAIKNGLDQYRLSKSFVVFRSVTLVPSDTTINVTGIASGDPDHPTSHDVYWGTSKTALINKQTITQEEFAAGEDITGLPKSTKIFLQFEPVAPDEVIGSKSGIYYAKTTA